MEKCADCGKKLINLNYDWNGRALHKKCFIKKEKRQEEINFCIRIVNKMDISEEEKEYMIATYSQQLKDFDDV
jgi:hypothetical protein